MAKFNNSKAPDCDEGPVSSLFAELLKLFSMLLILSTLPFSLFFIVKVVQVSSWINRQYFYSDIYIIIITNIQASSLLQEYERAVIFRLGRLVSGGARGPGVFFIIPCLDVYEKIDMRTSTYDVPPQEVLPLFVLYLI